MPVKTVFIKRHSAHAGKWIYQGYQNAWKEKGYTAIFYDDLNELRNFEDKYYLMTLDGCKMDSERLKIIERAEKAFMFVQPNQFPRPWGSHPNFYSMATDEIIQDVNGIESVYLWTFFNVEESKYYDKWKKVHTIPLAFDNIDYLPIKNEKYAQYDICFVGGWANNGFDEKRKIMLKYFSEFMKSNLKCGFFVNKGISQEQENLLLYNSKVSLNIHDAYQRILGGDTNERTFKSLGLNGILLSDEVNHLGSLFPFVKMSMSPADLVQMAKEYIMLPSIQLDEIKEKNRQYILNNHCYIHRVEKMLTL